MSAFKFLSFRKYFIMRKLILSFLLATTCFFYSNAQQATSDLQAIESTVNLYFDGWGTGDSSKVGKAMHSTCHLKYFRDGKFTDISRLDYLSKFKLHARPDSLVTRIASIDITDNIASVKAEIITATHLFTDYFNMIKTDEKWFIVDKISTNKKR
jgi:aldose sugar dehydrogenase